jgi:hypothetical protein
MGVRFFISAQVPNSCAINEVVEGNFQGNLFVGSSRGRLNGFNYIYGYNYWIRFVGNQARMIGRHLLILRHWSGGNLSSSLSASCPNRFCDLDEVFGVSRVTIFLFSSPIL